MTLKRKLAIIGVLLLGTMCVTMNTNTQPPPELMNCRSIVASVIRIVFGLQTQAAGLALPTDVNGEFLLSFPLSPESYQAYVDAATRVTHNARLLGHARSWHFPHRHQPPLHVLCPQERITAILRRQHSQ